MRFSEPHSPFVSAGNYSRYTTVNEGDVGALKPDGIFIPVLLAGSVICIIGLILASWSNFNDCEQQTDADVGRSLSR